MSRADADRIKIFAGRASRDLGEAICQTLDIPLGQGHTDMFPDGELIVKLEEDVRGRDCFVVQSTCHPVNANLMELLIYIDCLKRASARRITAVIPYFGYARQDRKDEGRVPVTAKLTANLITAAGADRVLALDLHAAQIQGFFDLPVDHMLAVPVFVQLRSVSICAAVVTAHRMFSSTIFSDPVRPMASPRSPERLLSCPSSCQNAAQKPTYT